MRQKYILSGENLFSRGKIVSCILQDACDAVASVLTFAELFATASQASCFLQSCLRRRRKRPVFCRVLCDSVASYSANVVGLSEGEYMFVENDAELALLTVGFLSFCGLRNAPELIGRYIKKKRLSHDNQSPLLTLNLIP